MLGKLIRYEISATGRSFLPFYAALIVFALINKLFFSFDTPVPDFIADVTMGIYIIIIIALVVLTYLVMIQRFYKNLLSDEGYLMFTLPVKSWQHITSKLVVAVMWMILSLLVTLFTIFLMVFNSEMIPHILKLMAEIRQEFAPFDQAITVSLFLRLGLTTFIGNVATILMIYTSIAIGHLFGKHRVLASFGAFLGINFAIQSATSLFMAFIMSSTVQRLDQFDGTFVELMNLLQGLFQVSNVVNIILGAVFFFITSYILQKKLNLE